MEFEQLIKLIEVMDASGLTEFDYESESTKLHLGRKVYKNLMVSGTQCDIRGDIHHISKNESEDAVSEEMMKKGTNVTAPIVGVFYAASSPTAEPFVKVGDHVEKGQVVGIIEAMKLMNEIQSDVSGTVTEIYVKNGDGVEYGQPIICVQE